jgi:hypothetical protein
MRTGFDGIHDFTGTNRTSCLAQEPAKHGYGIV